MIPLSSSATHQPGYGSYFSGWSGRPSAFGGEHGAIPTWQGNGGLGVRRSLSDADILGAIGTMRGSYATDPNYIRNMFPVGFEDWARDQTKDAARRGYDWTFGGSNSGNPTDMDFGLGPDNNYGLGPVSAANFMFLGSRGPRPQDNPASSQYAAQAAIRELGGPSPSYSLPSPGEGPLSYTVATDQELKDASRDFGGFSQGLGDFAFNQVEQQAKEDLARRQETARDDFRRWVAGNQHDPMVVEALGPVGTFGSPGALGQAALDWYDQNPRSDLAQRALGSSYGAVTNPSYHLMDPSEGIRNVAGSSTIRDDFSTMMGWRPENQIRQTQAYASMGDGQWGGVLNPETYSRPDFRQITGQTASPFSSFGGLGGLGGWAGITTPSLGPSGATTGAAYNPNPLAALAGGDGHEKSPWGGPWGGR